MAQTKKKRRRKHRGTQGGRIDTRPARGRPRSRAEAQARARSRGQKKRKPGDRTPQAAELVERPEEGRRRRGPLRRICSRSSARSLGSSRLIAVLMLGFYVPMAFLLDRFFYQRHLRKEAQKRQEREADRTGAHQAEG